MEPNLIDLLFCIFGTLTATLTCLLLFISSKVFSKEDFKHKKIFKYISINSALNGYLFILASLFPITQYFRKQVTNKTLSYFIEFISYYVVICVGSTIKTLSECTSVSISIYRLLELGRFSYLNKKIEYDVVLFYLTIISLLTTIPVYTWSKLEPVNNGTLYARQENVIIYFDHNITKLSIHLLRVLTIAKFLVNIIPNLYFMLIIKKLYKSRCYLLNINSSCKQKENLIDGNNTNRKRTTCCLRLLDLAKQELRIFYLIGSTSLIFTFDLILKFLFHYLAFSTVFSSIHQNYGYMINHFFVCLLNLLYVFCYYTFNTDFRVNFKQFFKKRNIFAENVYCE